MENKVVLISLSHVCDFTETLAPRLSPVVHQLGKTMEMFVIAKREVESYITLQLISPN